MLTFVVWFALICQNCAFDVVFNTKGWTDLCLLCVGFFVCGFVACRFVRLHSVYCTFFLFATANVITISLLIVSLTLIPLILFMS